MLKVHTSCPTRIDLAGGTLDLWPLYHQLKDKATVNVAIELRAEAVVEEAPSSSFIIESLDQNMRFEGSFSELIKSAKLPLHGLFLKALWSEALPPIVLRTKARSPKGAGLGGSSSLAIALCAALLKARELLGEVVQSDEAVLVAIAQDVESSIIKTPTGSQDYWAAVRGGLNLIEYPYGAPSVETLDPTFLETSDYVFLPVYSGQSRDSSLNNWSVYQSFFSGDEKTVRILGEIGELASFCLKAIKARNLEQAFDYSRREWLKRKELWPDIVTEQTELLDKLAKDCGALFTRVCGAGGGGVMSVFVEKAKKEALLKEIRKSPFEILEAGISKKGLLFL